MLIKTAYRGANTTGAADNGEAFEDESKAFSTCGTTALVVAVTDGYIFCCNAGDSRAVLATEAASRPLSRDHKPTSLEERKR